MNIAPSCTQCAGNDYKQIYNYMYVLINFSVLLLIPYRGCGVIFKDCALIGG